MLKVKDLENQLKEIYSTILPPAVEQVLLTIQPTKTKMGEDIAKHAAELFDDMVSGPLAEMVSQAIDSYIKNISVVGTVITKGSSFTQTANITAASSPKVAGKKPNTFGIT